MTIAQLHTILPFLVLAASVALLLLVTAFYRNYTLIAVLTVLSLAGALVSLWFTAGPADPPLLLVAVDGFAKYYIALFLGATIAITLIAHGYFRARGTHFQEFYILLLLAATGSSVLAASRHFVSLFMGLELLSVSLYALIAYLRGSARGIEAGVKYLILAAASSAFLLFGMALVYAETGSMEFAGISAVLQAGGAEGPLTIAAFCLIIVGFGFKLAVVPFHMWTPDVYEGAPAPVAAFIATISKGAMFSLLMRFFYVLAPLRSASMMLIFTAISVASMCAGNFLALGQRNVKRMLAYSSIAHLGYLLVPFIAGGSMANEAVAFYLAAYFITTLGAFGTVAVMSSKERDADMLDDYRGLFRDRPLLAALFTGSLLSLAGIPLTAGFLGKYYLVLAGGGAGLWALVIVLIVNSAVSLYYYLRVVAAMFQSDGGTAAPRSVPSLSILGGIALATLALLILWVGVYPQTLIDIIRLFVSL